MSKELHEEYFSAMAQQDYDKAESVVNKISYGLREYDLDDLWETYEKVKLAEKNIKLLQDIARNKPQEDYYWSHLGDWMTAMAEDLPKADVSDLDKAMEWLESWLPHIRATRELGITAEGDFYNEENAEGIDPTNR